MSRLDQLKLRHKDLGRIDYCLVLCVTLLYDKCYRYKSD